MNMYKRKPIKRYQQRDDFWGAVEALIYEMKPLGYLIFAVAVLRAGVSSSLMIKYGAVGIALFSIYLIFGRLSHRGYL